MISAVIPAFNAEAFLGQAIDSVLAQSAGNIELILIDDGSTDLSVNKRRVAVLSVNKRRVGVLTSIASSTRVDVTGPSSAWQVSWRGAGAS